MQTSTHLSHLNRIPVSVYINAQDQGRGHVIESTAPQNVVTGISKEQVRVTHIQMATNPNQILFPLYSFDFEC